MRKAGVTAAVAGMPDRYVDWKWVMKASAALEISLSWRSDLEALMGLVGSSKNS